MRQRADTALDAVTMKEQGHFTCTHEGVAHDFFVCPPDKTENAPLIVMLHGYGESAEAFRLKTHFEKAAIPRGYAVVYVTGAPDPNDPTSANGWNAGIAQDGNRDVDFLIALAEYLQREYGFDPRRTFAVGFSNGAFMTHRLAMEAAEIYSACVSVAGKMPESVWNERNEKNDVGFFQVTGEKDDVVPKNADGSAGYAKDPAIEEVMEYWVKSNGASPVGEEEIGKGSRLEKYGAANRQVWNLTVKGGRHSWPDTKISGIDLDSLILDFLQTREKK